MAMKITNNYDNFTLYNAAKESTQSYLRRLQRQVPYLKLGVGCGLSKVGNTKVNALNINPGLLNQMQNNPEKEQEYIQRLKDIQFAVRMADSYHKSTGSKVIYRYCYLDGDGKYYTCAYSKKEDKISGRLREERRKNAEKLIKRTRAKAISKRKALQKSSVGSRVDLRL